MPPPDSGTLGDIGGQLGQLGTFRDFLGLLEMQKELWRELSLCVRGVLVSLLWIISEILILMIPDKTIMINYDTLRILWGSATEGSGQGNSCKFTSSSRHACIKFLEIIRLTWCKFLINSFVPGDIIISSGTWRDFIENKRSSW